MKIVFGVHLLLCSIVLAWSQQSHVWSFVNPHLHLPKITSVYSSYRRCYQGSFLKRIVLGNSPVISLNWIVLSNCLDLSRPTFRGTLDLFKALNPLPFRWISGGAPGPKKRWRHARAPIIFSSWPCKIWHQRLYFSPIHRSPSLSWLLKVRYWLKTTLRYCWCAWVTIGLLLCSFFLGIVFSFQVMIFGDVTIGGIMEMVLKTFTMLNLLHIFLTLHWRSRAVEAPKIFRLPSRVPPTNKHTLLVSSAPQAPSPSSPSPLITAHHHRGPRQSTQQAWTPW